jgi:serine/threonine-protein kinase HipA
LDLTGTISESLPPSHKPLHTNDFVYEGTGGWRLSPAYDLNPVPVDIKPRVLTTAINEDDTTASLDLAFQVASYFELKNREARKIADVAEGVANWRREASRHGLSDRTSP